MAAAKTEFLEALNDAARKLAAREGISFSVAYGRVLDQNPGARIVLWAHNGHVNFGHAQDKYKPMGEWLRQWYGDQMVVFGFAFNQGSFQAIEQDKRLHDFTIGPAPTDGFDAMLASAGIPLFALDLRQLPKTGPAVDWFNRPHLARSIGAVYSESAADIYFRPLVAPQTFNVILYVDKTTAARKNDALPPPKRPSFSLSRAPRP